MKPPLLMELHYLPSLEYFTAMCAFDQLVIEKQESYIKQSYRNRCRILTANRVMELSIPVKKQTSHRLISEVEIDHDQKWLPHHWKTIYSAYGNAPFFEHFAEYFHRVLFKRHRFLFDLNWELLEVILELLQWSKKVAITELFVRTPAPGYNDLRGQIHPKKAYQINNIYEPCNYNQVFGKKFVGNLSIIDLLFCQGLGAGKIIEQSLIQCT